MTAPAALRRLHDNGKVLVLQRQRDAQILELLLIDDVGGTAHRLTGFLEEKFGLPAVSANILRKKFLTADKQLFV